MIAGTQSACTLVTAYIPKDRICFSDRAVLAFHHSWFAETGEINPKGTKWMIDSYPADIRGWIVAYGGLAKMPIGSSYWTLPAKELWEMGYRRCNIPTLGSGHSYSLTILTYSQRQAHWHWCREFIDRERIIRELIYRVQRSRHLRVPDASSTEPGRRGCRRPCGRAALQSSDVGDPHHSAAHGPAAKLRVS